MRYFLLVYDNNALKVVEREEFTVEQRADATRRRRELQLRFRGHPEAEILLFGADRFEDLAKTHRRFFPESETIEETVAAAASTSLANN